MPVEETPDECARCEAKGVHIDPVSWICDKCKEETKGFKFVFGG